MNKLLVILLLCCSLFACSYEPIFSNKKFNLKFTDISFKGDFKINKIIKDNLSKKVKGDKEFELYFFTEKNKEVVSSNAKGDPTIYKITIDLDYFIKKSGEIIFEENIKKNLTYNNIDDKFELLKYEDNIVLNLSKNISDEILMSVIALE